MKQLSFLTIIMFALLSCNKAKNTNEIFNAFDANSKLYKQELATQIATNGDDLTYSFNNYLIIDNKPYLDITVSGNNINAKALVLVNNWNKLEGIKRTKGIGYVGAELEDLKLDVANSNSGPVLIYKDLASIID